MSSWVHPNSHGYHHGAQPPAPSGPPYPHDFPPDIKQPPSYGPIPQIPPRPSQYGQATQPHKPMNDPRYSRPARPPMRVAKNARIDFNTLKNMFIGDKVSVNLTANGWVVGTVVSVLQFFHAISGVGYEVDYEMNGHVTRDAFRAEPEYMQPYGDY